MERERRRGTAVEEVVEESGGECGACAAVGLVGAGSGVMPGASTKRMPLFVRDSDGGVDGAGEGAAKSAADASEIDVDGASDRCVDGCVRGWTRGGGAIL